MPGASSLRRLKSLPWFAEALAFLGGVAYFIQTWVYAHAQDSVLDEGLYLLKGLFFVSGEYQPFQPYGVWTNHMPFSFLIPGYFQTLFGPGLRAGRYFAIGIGILFVLGAWVVARRLGGRWWAACGVFAIAMNPALIKTYSVVASQGLVACLLVWVLVFVVGDDRPRWQIIFGAALASVLALTRLNMTPVLMFVLIYIFWQHGHRTGLWASLAGMAVFLGAHIYYYPGIMTLWVKWFPPDLTPFLSMWRYQGVGQIPRSEVSSTARLASLFQGVYLHFIPLVGIITGWILWPKNWPQKDRRIAILFSVLYALLLVMHGWSSLGGIHCVYCFSGYQFFFEILAFFVIVVTSRGWRWRLSIWRKIFSWAVIATIVSGLVLGYVFHIGSGAKTGLDVLIRDFMTMPVPRLVDWRVQPGQIELWGLVSNKFALMERYSYEGAYQLIENGLRVFSSLLLGGAILAVLWWLAGGMRRRIRASSAGVMKADRSALALVIFFLVGWGLTPIGILGRSADGYACDRDVIASYETAGQQLAAQVPAGAQVYWLGGDTQALLLYLEDVNFYPAQLNADFSLREGDADILVKYGFWSDELARQWAREADVILIEERMYGGWLANYVTSGEFSELAPIPEVGCRDGSSLHVYQRQP